jgi:hypothetical protein
LEGKKAEDDEIEKAMDRIANARLQANEDINLLRNLETKARRAALEETRGGGWHWRRRRWPVMSTNP